MAQASADIAVTVARRIALSLDVRALGAADTSTVRGALQHVVTQAGFSVPAPSCWSTRPYEDCVAATFMHAAARGAGDGRTLRLTISAYETGELFAEVVGELKQPADSAVVSDLAHRLLALAELSPARPWAPAPVARFTVAQVAGCYEFDAPHFRVFAFDRSSRTSSSMNSPVIRLFVDPSVSRLGRGLRRVEIVAGLTGDSVLARYRDHSGWRFARGDSIRVEWLDGFSGPILRLAVAESTLVGVVKQTSDAIDVRNPPQWVPTRAERIACPGAR